MGGFVIVWSRWLPFSVLSGPDRLPGHDVIAGLVFGAGAAVAAASGFALLTRVEQSGLRVLSRARGTRLPADAAHAVVAHGGVGWVIMGFWVAVGLTALSYAKWVGFWVADVGALAGFLWFEVFAWLGLRRLRWANLPRADAANPEGGESTKVGHAETASEQTDPTRG